MRSSKRCTTSFRGENHRQAMLALGKDPEQLKTLTEELMSAFGPAEMCCFFARPGGSANFKSDKTWAPSLIACGRGVLGKAAVLGRLGLTGKN